MVEQISNLFDSLQNTIIEIKSLKYNNETKTYSLVTEKNDVKVSYVKIMNEFILELVEEL